MTDLKSLLAEDGIILTNYNTDSSLHQRTMYVGYNDLWTVSEYRTINSQGRIVYTGDNEEEALSFFKTGKARCI